ncbi:MAG: GLUG motif-containing protein [Candidatus Woesearchaeota archaeon]
MKLKLLILLFLIIISGTIFSYEEISTCEELQEINEDSSKDYILINDIDCYDTINWNNGEGFLPIPLKEDCEDYKGKTGFNGTFDGRGHVIKNLFINRSETCFVGVFSHLLSEGSIRNVGVINATIYGHDRTGTILAFNDGFVDQTFSEGHYVYGHNNIGGLIGENQAGKITNSYAIGKVLGHVFVGGLIGDNDSGEIENTYSIVQIKGMIDLGGLSGYQRKEGFKSSYWDLEKSNINISDGGKSLFGSDFSNRSKFIGWDFESVWEIKEGYPKLSFKNISKLPKKERKVTDYSSIIFPMLTAALIFILITSLTFQKKEY